MQHKFVFFGSSEFSIVCLEALRATDTLPSGIVTLPDSPQGRGRELTPNIVKTWADTHDVPCITPTSLRDTASVAEVTDFVKGVGAEALLVASYGKILPKTVLEMTAGGAINIHPSLLPKYRGPSPIKSAILADDVDTGVSLMRMDEEMDHGPVIDQRALTGENLANAQITWPAKDVELETLLGTMGANLFVSILPGWLSNTLTATEQDHTKATYTHKFTKEDGRIFLSGGRSSYLTFCAFHRNPGCFFMDTHGEREMRVKILDAQLSDNGEFVPVTVVPEGRKAMSYESYLRGKK